MESVFDESLDILGLDPDKVFRLTHIRIIYPRLKSVLNMIKYCHDISKIQGTSECLCIHGNTGVGKSEIIDTYMEQFPDVISNHGLVKRVVKILVPEEATKKSLALQLLAELGDGNASYGNKTDLTIRCVKLIKDQKVELMFFDEAQHFIDSRYEQPAAVAQWFKNLITATKVPIVMIGTSECLKVFKDEQLRRRFSNMQVIAPFRWGDTEIDQIEFKTLLTNIDECLPFATTSKIDSDDMGSRIFYATSGIIYYVMKLITYAGILSLKKGNDRITKDILSQAFAEKLWGFQPRIKENPFIPIKFDIDLAFNSEIPNVPKENKQDDEVLIRGRRGKRRRRSTGIA